MNIVSKEELEAEMVSSSGKRIFTNSLKYSEEFGFEHRHTLEKIANLTAEHSAVRSEFKESTFINERNREYLYFEMTRNGYMTLIMQMGQVSGRSSKKANKIRSRLIFDKQQQFLKAFNKMEQMLLQKSNEEWKSIRGQSKIARKEETDTIKQFIEYATTQGSKNAKHYYSNITKATYKALSLLEHKKPKTRDTLDMMELNQLVLAEHIVTKVILLEMEAETPYRDIYQSAKEALMNFADTLYLKELT